METNAHLFATVVMNGAEENLRDIFAKPMTFPASENIRNAYEAVGKPTFWRDSILNMADRLLGEEK